MVNKRMKACPKCGANKLSPWHFYNKYGRNGAYLCYGCGSRFKAVRDRRTNALKVGKFIEQIKQK